MQNLRLRCCAVPDTRSHRGAHLEDARLFSDDAVPRLRAATADLSWLLSRGYAQAGALQLVGNRYELEQRQRQAVSRCACTDEARARRLNGRVAPDALAGATLLVDGYNVLTTVEAALGGAVVLRARDGACRDIAGVHGTYRAVEETVPALRLVGETVAGLGVARCVWFLDAPVSNSGRLKGIIDAVARERAWAWEVRVVPNPDAELAAAAPAPDIVVATADSVVMDACPRWFGLAAETISRKLPGARVIDLSQ